MEKNIKDYLHLYLGCEVEYDGILNGKELKEEREANKHDVFYTPQIQERKGIKVGLLKEVRYNKGGFAVCYVGNKSKKGYWGSASGLKLILRPLSDMTEEEYDEMEAMQTDELLEVKKEEFEFDYRPDTAETTRYLLSKHFDIFGLIESGLAIDAMKTERTSE